jgi:hypothetical protein
VEGSRPKDEGQEEGEAVTTACKRCGRPKPPLAIQHGDLFCSTECSKAAHGVKDTWIGDPRRLKHSIDYIVEQRAMPKATTAAR